MSKKEKYEIPVSEPLQHGDPCGSKHLACLHEGEARKEARRIPSFQGSIHQALPHSACGWWHIYTITPKRRSVAQRKKDAKEDFKIREILESGNG